MKQNRKPKKKTAKTKSSYQIQLLCEACILSNHTKQIGTYSCTTPNLAIGIITANTNNNSNKFIFASCQCRCHTHFRLNFKLQACCWQFYLVNWYSWENCAHNAYRSQFQFKCKFHTMIPICEQTNNNRKKKKTTAIEIIRKFFHSHVFGWLIDDMDKNERIEEEEYQFTKPVCKCFK